MWLREAKALRVDVILTKTHNFILRRIFLLSSPDVHTLLRPLFYCRHRNNYIFSHFSPDFALLRANVLRLCRCRRGFDLLFKLWASSTPLAKMFPSFSLCSLNGASVIMRYPMRNTPKLWMRTRWRTSTEGCGCGWWDFNLKFLSVCLRRREWEIWVVIVSWE